MTEERCFESNCIEVNEYVDDATGKTYIRIRSTETGTVMQCTPEEWRAFDAGIKLDRWAHIGQETAVTS